MLATRFRILCSLALGLLALSSGAVPPCPWPVECKQPDGKTVELLVRGDENFHYFENPATGELLLRDEQGWLAPVQRSEINAIRNVDMKQPLGLGIHTSNITPSGTPKVCVILVEFADVKFGMSDPQGYFNRWLNQEGFSDNGATGSVRDYFRAQSSGGFEPDFQVYGPVTLKSNCSTYAASGAAYKMVHEGAAAIDSQVDFKQFDLNSDGNVNCVCIIYAGVGANYGGENVPWPHNSECPTSLFTRKKVDGKVLAHYMCVCESGYVNPDGIGTFVHEFSHTIGLPDLYDTTSSHSRTPRYWSVMDIGCYLNMSRTPCNYSAFERRACEWLYYHTLSSPANVNLRPMSEHNFACVVETGRDRDFYVLENRVASGWDKYLPGEGMLIWHIDGYNESSLTSKPNNNSSHMHVDLVRADNNYDQYFEGDPWPGSSNNRQFTSTSVPPMVKWVSDNSSEVTPVDKPITEITRRNADGLVSFKFLGGDAQNVVDPDPEPALSYRASASPAPGGKVYFGNDEGCASVSVNEYDKVEIHAVANSGYRFQRWTYNGNQFSLAPNVSFFAGADNAGEYVAEFYKLPEDKYTYTVSATPQEGGTVYIGSDRSVTTYAAEYGESVALHAEPAPGYEFARWNRDGSIYSNSPTLTIRAGISSEGAYEAVFVKVTTGKYVITVSADPSDYGYAYIGDDESAVRYEADPRELVRIHAVSYSGYEFSYWRFNGAPRPYMQNYLIDAGEDSAGEYVATFEVNLGGVDRVENDGIPHFRVSGRTVTVQSQHPVEVTLTGMSGIAAARARVCGSRSFEIAVPGIYVLKIDSVAHRIAVY